MSLTLFALLAAFLLAAAVSDLLTMTIPNKLTLALAALFFVAAVAVHMPLTLFAWHLAAGALVLAVCFALFAFGWIGGGDAKFASGVALWLGFDLLMPWLFMTALFGGLLTVLLLVGRRFPLPVRLYTHDWIMRLHAPETGVPYGIAIATGAAWVLPMTYWAKLLN